MDREILFRGKRLDNKKWVYGYLICCAGRQFIVDQSNQTALRSFTTHHCDRYDWRSVEVNPPTVGQYTGLTDKCGVRIFEGDIVRWIWEPYVLVSPGGYCRYAYGTKFEVRLLESGFMLCKVGDQMPNVPNANGKVANYEFWNYHKGLEIIGNVHDKEQRDQ